MGGPKPEGSGFTRDNFEAHVREEFSTFDWVLEGMLAKAGFAIEAGRQVPALVCRLHLLGNASVGADS